MHPGIVPLFPPPKRSTVVNLQALYHLKTENPQAINRAATENGLDPVVAMGVAILLIANDGNLASLSAKQRQHFDVAIAPLLK